MSYIKKRKRNGRVYLEEVESIRVNGKVKQKHLRYIGKEVDNKTIVYKKVLHDDVIQLFIEVKYEKVNIPKDVPKNVKYFSEVKVSYFTMTLTSKTDVPPEN